MAVLVLSCSFLVHGLEVQVSNETLPQQAEQMQLTSQSGAMTITAAVEPLTESVGLGGSAVLINGIKIEGVAKLATASTASNIERGNIAIVSCDFNANSSNILPQDIVESFIANEPRAVVFYTLTSGHCAVSNIGAYTTYFTARDLDKEKFQMLLSLGTSAQIASSGRSSRTNPASDGTTTTRKNPTPAVAMSILYAVTGIITILFLIIIATGAYRAHNNPERYGPRTSIAGRPRQSRAKGLARAMLETLPIVKFGDPVPMKPEGRDIELEGSKSNQSHGHAANDSLHHTEAVPEPSPNNATSSNSPSMSEGPVLEPVVNAEQQNSNLGCSICTEDFTKGEDVRVLPCNHQYHPTCIDPWLLNVSGTCPLCRIDLRPVKTEAGVVPNSDEAPPASPTAVNESDNHTNPSRVQRIMATRHASVQERIVTLRQLAAEAGVDRRGQAATPVTAEEVTRRRRLADRLRSRFRIRTRENGVTEAAPSRGASPTPVAGEANARV